MPSPPSYQKVNPADQPVLYIALNSPTMRLSDVDEYAETLIAQRISMVNGVAQVQVLGVQKYAVRVNSIRKPWRAAKLESTRLERRFSRVTSICLRARCTHHQAFTVQANGQLQSG